MVEEYPFISGNNKPKLIYNNIGQIIDLKIVSAILSRFKKNKYKCQHSLKNKNRV